MTTPACRLSIDPGLSATGIAIWPAAGGRPEILTLRPGPANSWHERLADLARLLSPIFCRPIIQMAIEDFVTFYPRQKSDSLKKLFTATGLTIGMAMAKDIPVIHVCKGTESKAKTNQITAALFGKDFRSSQDARDAIYIGLLAGYHKPIGAQK